MTRPPFPPRSVVASANGVTIFRQASEFGALYEARRGDAPPLYRTNRRGEALAWLAGYGAAITIPR